jgi:hypothetical protein
MTAFEKSDLERLAKLVVARRLELALGVHPAATRAGISKDTWKRVEAGMTVRATTYTDIERVLQWATGSCRGILEGGEPRPADAVKVTEIPASAIEQEDIRQAVSSAIIGTRGDLTGAEIVEINDKVLAELRRRGLI